ncbi:MAG: N-6 DNA methylase [Candidatus Peregrinibacteria bacterium]
MNKILTIQQKDGKIYSPIREKWLEETPEELVRQAFICELVNEYEYRLDQMEEEKALTERSDRGTGKASADIVIWKSKEERLQNKNAFIVVECKAESITLSNKDYFQGANYARWSGSEILVVVNSILREKEEEDRQGRKIKIKDREGDLRIFKILKDSLPYSKQPISSIPNASLALNEEKLREELLNTTTMTRDDFAKLLLQCHNIIRNNDKLSPEAAFDEISKILFIKIRYEREGSKKKSHGNRFSLSYFKDSRKNYEGFKAQGDRPFYQVLFEKTKQDFEKDNLFAENETINIRENSFEEIVEKLQIYDLSNTSDDVKGIAFEQFLGRTFRGELGQFFTPRTIVDFMVGVLDPQEGELVCDPACGSGGFLIKAFEYIRDQIELDVEGKIERINEEVFGKVDKDASEEEKEDFQKRLNDPALQEEAEKRISPLEAELKLSLDRDTIKTRIDRLSKTCIFGTDANPRMARVSKMNMIMHGDGHGGVHHNDGLLNVNGIFENRFDVILANPPFGSRVPKDLKIEEADQYKDEKKIKKYKEMYGEEYEKALKQVTDNIGNNLVDLYDTGSMSTLTEVLFIERCLKLLKKGGRMGIVLPEGVLNNSNLQKVREYFESKAKIILIVSIPQDVFVASGATVKPSLVFLKKFTETEETEYAEIKVRTESEVNAEYKMPEEELNQKIKEAKTANEKKELRDELKQVEEQKNEKVKRLVKERFDYAIPIAEVEKAGISTTGSVIENELEPLKEEFKTYRKEKNIW